MHKMILGQRMAVAHARVMAAVQKLAEEFETSKPAVQKLEAVQDKDPQIKQLHQEEAMAEVLEAIVAEMNTPEPVPAPAPKPAVKTAK